MDFLKRSYEQFWIFGGRDDTHIMKQLWSFYLKNKYTYKSKYLNNLLIRSSTPNAKLVPWL